MGPLRELLSLDSWTNSWFQSKEHGDSAISKMSCMTGFERKQSFGLQNALFALGRTRKLTSDEKMEKASRKQT